MEASPRRSPNDGSDGEPDTDTAHWGRGADFEFEPVADVGGGGMPEVRLGSRKRDLAVQVDVERAASPKVACHERGRAFDDPVSVKYVQPFEQAVVGNVTLELRQRPSTVPCQCLQPISERPAECSRRG